MYLSHAPETDRTGQSDLPRIPVTIHAQDPVSRAGVRSQLREHPALDVTEAAVPGAGAVAVLVVESLDEVAYARLRKVVRGDGSRSVLVVSSLRGQELLDVVECGVGAVVWRHEATPSRLLQAVLAASRGDGHLPGDLLSRLMSQAGTLHRGATGRPDVAPAGLTARETDVLRLIADGMETREVAAELAYSERTVKTVLQGVTMRLHLRNRTHAVAYALREGLI
ncbi:helix-turn-helix transcriptional regulator [Streptomyces sp. CRN 30]|uniref:helix-turn-helix transcriptional regulator n=1 Tax=Streptomyces sp. CRN 30 TaxID=3075613 RepID=UPI002A804616|nr:LuxR C-terminal-related transcriptional regulator [Streptomyces sp. CRN 30]